MSYRAEVILQLTYKHYVLLNFLYIKSLHTLYLHIRLKLFLGNKLIVLVVNKPNYISCNTTILTCKQQQPVQVSPPKIVDPPLISLNKESFNSVTSAFLKYSLLFKLIFFMIISLLIKYGYFD